MSILIKGMEMPTSRGEYELRMYVDSDGAATVEGAYCRFDGEPFEAIPVPPHGDLIDRDAYEKLLRGLGSRDYRREKGTICDAIKFLHPHYAPTIIPAEEGE